MSIQSFKVKSGLTLTPVDLATLVNPQAGDLACDINDANKIKRYDTASSSWKEVGEAGGAADVNALLIQTFDQAVLGDFTQTGLSLVTANAINGTQSARLISTGSTQSFKQVKAVDRKFRNQLMQLSLSLQSTTTQGYVLLQVRDETNSVNLIDSEQLTTGSQLIFSLSISNGSPTISGFTNDIINTLAVGARVTGTGIPTGSIITAINTTARTVTISQNATATNSNTFLSFSSLPERQVVSFRIPASCASLSYTVTAMPESLSPETYVDDVVIELAETALLETSVEVPVVTAWQGYTPTFQGFGTPTNVEFEWRQVGENVEIRGKFNAGTVTAVEARVGLPAGLTSAGTNLIPSLQSIGRFANNITATAIPNGSGNILIEPSVSYVTFSGESTGAVSLTKLNASLISLNGTIFSFFASVPCAGLSATTTKTIPLTQSGLIQEADSYLFVSGNGGQALTANTTNIPFANTQSNKGDAFSFNGSQITVLKDGTFSFDATIVTTASTSNRLGIYKNGALVSTSTSITSNIHSYSINLNLVRNDIISLRVQDTNATLSNSTAHTLQCTYQGSLKQVSVITNQKATIPTSELQFRSSVTKGTGSEAATVQFSTQSVLRGDAFSISNSNGTVITMLKAGKLSVSASLLTTAAASFAITKNQQINSSFSPTASEIVASATTVTPTFHSSVSGETDVNVGDVIRVSTGGTPNSTTFNALNLSFQEQSVQVSVSNTLPQFSESDLVVRAAGNAGQSITANVTNIPFITISDTTGGAWNGSQFTVPETGVYTITVALQFTTSVARNISMYLDGAYSRAISDYTTNTYFNGGTTEQFTAGQVVSIRVSSGGTLLNSADHFLSITKVGKPNVTGVDVTPFVNVPQPDFAHARFTGRNTISSGNMVFDTVDELFGNGIINVDTSLTYHRVVILKPCYIDINYGTGSSSLSNTAYAIYLYKNGTSLASAQPGDAGAGNIPSPFVAFSGKANIGDIFTFGAPAGAPAYGDVTVYANLKATALSDQILTAPETFSTDTAALQWASSAQYTLSTLANAPIGTYITFGYTANTNGRAQMPTRPTQTDADMNANGIQIFTRAYNANSTAAQPVAFAIQIGKGLKGLNLGLYKSAGKVTAGGVDFSQLSANQQRGIIIKDYNEVTGILVVDAGVAATTITTYDFLFSDITTQTSGYLVINASKNPALTGLGLRTVAARAKQSSGQSIAASGVETVMTYDAAKTIDTNGALNAATGVFTCPEAGNYRVSAAFLTGNLAWTAGNYYQISIFKNGAMFSSKYSQVEAAVTQYKGNNIADVVPLNKGDTVTISLSISRSAGATTLDVTGNYNYVSINKVNLAGGN